MSAVHAPARCREHPEQFRRRLAKAGRGSEAVTQLLQAVVLYRRLDDRSGLATSLLNLGGTYALFRKPNVATEFTTHRKRPRRSRSPTGSANRCGTRRGRRMPRTISVSRCVRCGCSSKASGIWVRRWSTTRIRDRTTKLAVHVGIWSAPSWQPPELRIPHLPPVRLFPARAPSSVLAQQWRGRISAKRPLPMVRRPGMHNCQQPWRCLSPFSLVAGTELELRPLGYELRAKGFRVLAKSRKRRSVRIGCHTRCAQSH